MGIIKAFKLGFDYFKYDEDGNVQEMQRAVDDINLDIEAGSFVAILGHNGSGKSTLAKQLNALLLPSEGTIWVDDMDTSKEQELWKIRQKAGMVFQNPDNQIVTDTVWHELAFGLENLGYETGTIRLRVAEMASFFGIQTWFEKNVEELSGGQKRRVAIAGVMAMEPKILVLDEPAAGLDPEGRDTILSQIRNYHEQTGITVILVSHSMEDIARYANRVLVMSKAKVAMYDTVEKVFARAPELLELGLSVPQVTQVFLMLKAMGMEIDTDVYTVPYAVKTVLKAWNAKHPDKAVPLPQNHKTVQEGGAD